ncbi:hypothetical protein ACFOUP_12840 [Belliella kenyensis]|uniref:Uncharacterized protein n=1 Tax=Belliella kenyensis TaxID=1472724 RepID=A0ABV8EMX5_9BACT|nr:hypothetical protein [Belliella kenyensis]MCH7400860.1 hypothetical protein [Belliella kenyensis]MDN3601853.1 hypothetical protein [Belliella kenyensis]
MENKGIIDWKNWIGIGSGTSSDLACFQKVIGLAGLTEPAGIDKGVECLFKAQTEESSLSLLLLASLGLCLLVYAHQTPAVLPTYPPTYAIPMQIQIHGERPWVDTTMIYTMYNHKQ